MSEGLGPVLRTASSPTRHGPTRQPRSEPGRYVPPIAATPVCLCSRTSLLTATGRLADARGDMSCDSGGGDVDAVIENDVIAVSDASSPPEPNLMLCRIYGPLLASAPVLVMVR